MTRTHELSFEEDVIDRLARIETHVLAVTDHETRIRTVEHRQYLLAGAAAFIGTISNHVAGLFPWK